MSAVDAERLQRALQAEREAVYRYWLAGGLTASADLAQARVTLDALIEQVAAP